MADTNTNDWICEKCNTKNPYDAQFCIICGDPLAETGETTKLHSDVVESTNKPTYQPTRSKYQPPQFNYPTPPIYSKRPDRSNQQSTSIRILLVILFCIFMGFAIAAGTAAITSIEVAKRLPGGSVGFGASSAYGISLVAKLPVALVLIVSPISALLGWILFRLIF